MAPQPKSCPASTTADEDIAQMRRDISEIKSALIGDETMGRVGLFTRMRTAEKFIYIILAALLIMGGDRVIALLFH